MLPPISPHILLPDFSNFPGNLVTYILPGAVFIVQIIQNGINERSYAVGPLEIVALVREVVA